MPDQQAPTDCDLLINRLKQASDSLDRKEIINQFDFRAMSLDQIFKVIESIQHDIEASKLFCKKLEQQIDLSAAEPEKVLELWKQIRMWIGKDFYKKLDISQTTRL